MNKYRVHCTINFAPDLKDRGYVSTWRDFNYKADMDKWILHNMHRIVNYKIIRINK